MVIAGPRSPALPALAEAIEDLGCERRDCLENHEAECLRQVGGALVVTVLLQGLASSLKSARLVYGLAPLSHLVFVADESERAKLRNEMRLAPMIGTHWSIVDPDPSQLRTALETAVRSARQRQALRTTLDRINLRLTSRPPRDSEDYRELVISDRYLASILNYAQDAIVSVDPGRRIASWNRGAETIFRLTEREAVGRQLVDLASARHRAELEGWFAAARGGQPVIQREIECVRANGARFFAEVSLAPILNPTGETIAVSLTARDVSERKRGEEELRKMRDELEERVARRTEDLQALNRELEAFTYSASHDLRAPLRGIDGFSQALLEDYGAALDDTGRHYIERIQKGAKRMGEIIDALLMLSRISRTELRLEPIDLTAMCHSIVTDLRTAEPARSVEIEIEGGLHVRADERLLRIALENLIGNAWKFTRDVRHPRIEVGAEVHEGETIYRVCDNGAGFNMAYSDKLFVPFQRLHAPMRFEGTGIGLGTVQRIIHRHGGRIWAEGEVDRGAAFFFTLGEPVSNEDRAGRQAVSS